MLELFWEIITIFGDIRLWVGLTIAFLIFYILSRRERKKIAWVVFALLPAVILSYQITNFSKDFFKIPRPCLGLEYCPSSYSFPSGHATIIFAFASVVALAAKRKEFVVLSFLLAVLVSLSRVYLNLHTFADVFAGALIGIFTGCLVYKAYHKASEKINFKHII
jgi:undecaprenyl-diphosphatase